MLNWSRSSLFLAVAAAGLLLVAGSGTRLGLWEFGFGFDLLRAAAVAALAGALLAAAGLAVRHVRQGQASMLVKAALLSVGVLSVPFYWFQMARSVPAIHDISTDLRDPPPFIEVLERRGANANPPEHDGAEVARKQREAYPEVVPLMLQTSAQQAFDWALAAARQQGWEIVASDSEQGRIEATDTTFWFRFKDDIVVRVRQAEHGSRVDVRSKSRIGRSDLGTNARRITNYLDAVRALASQASVAAEPLEQQSH